MKYRAIYAGIYFSGLFTTCTINGPECCLLDTGPIVSSIYKFIRDLL